VEADREYEMGEGEGGERMKGRGERVKNDDDCLLILSNSD